MGTLVLLGFASGAAAAKPPAITFVEIGEKGTVFPDAPVQIDLEIRTEEPFRGRLEAVTHLNIPKEAQGNPALEFLWRNRSALELELPAGARVRRTLLFPFGVSQPPQLRSAELDWKLRDETGRARLQGRETLRVAEGNPWSRPDRTLRISDVPGPGWRRTPKEAWDTPSRYDPFWMVVISGTDLSALEAAPKQALFDAVAVGGRTLVIVPPLAALPPELESRLGEERALVWKGKDGSEVREARFQYGRVRTTSSTTAARQPGKELKDPLEGFALLPGSLAGEWAKFGPIETLPAHEESSLGPSTIALPLLSGIALFFFFRSSRSEKPLGRRGIRRLAVAVAVLPLPVWALLARFPRGSPDSTVRMIHHDPFRSVDVTEEISSSGRGGGTARPTLRFSIGPRSVLSHLEGRQEPSFSLDGRNSLRAESSRVARGPDRALDCSLYTAVPSDPAFDGVVRWDGRVLTGELRPRQDFENVLLVAPFGVFRLGSATTGRTISVRAEKRGKGEPPGDRLTDEERGLLSASFSTSSWVRGALVSVVAAEGSGPRSPAAGSPGPVIHRQPLRFASEDRPAVGGSFRAPAWFDGKTITAWMPVLVADRLELEGAIYSFDLLEKPAWFDVDDKSAKIDAEEVAGFRRVSCRVKNLSGMAPGRGSLRVYVPDRGGLQVFVPDRREGQV